MNSRAPRLAVFDLDLTLTTRHLWKQLSYHRRGAEELNHQSRETWIADLGGPEEFQPDRLRALFESLQTDGLRAGIATYNKESVARAFLRTFEFQEFFAPHMILSRDTADGPKTDYLEAMARANGLSAAAELEASLYFDDDREECENVKTALPAMRVYYVASPLASPASQIIEIT